MKKFLSLALSLAMTLSLITVSAGAKEFPDGDKLSGDVYEEAVNVMSEMGIIDGYTDGEFKPQDTLTRGAASKIIACMMLGKTAAEALGTSAAPFKDVPLGSTFAGYIAFCVESGIIDGYADGTFRPGNTLTGFAFQKMLLTALGYDSKVENYVNNPNWRVNVGARAKQEGLLNGLDETTYKGSDPATREQAALMALNTIKTPLVEYTNKGGSLTINGATIGMNASEAKYVTTVDKSRADSISDRKYQTVATGSTDAYFVEFGERYQPDLLRTFSRDDFGRPAYTWTWQRKEVGKYVDYSLLISEYNTGVTGRALRDDITQSAIDRVASSGEYWYYVDGVLSAKKAPSDTTTVTYGEKKIDDIPVVPISLETNLVRGSETDVGMTKNGVLTQVFLDRNTSDGNWELTITSIDTWLAKANSDYNSTSEELSVTAYTKKDSSDNSTITKNLKIDVEDVPEIENVKKDDFILIQRSGMDSSGNNPVLNVVGIKDPEILSDQTVTQFSKGGNAVDGRAIDKLTTGGQQYNFSQKCFYDAEALDEYDQSLLTNMTYDIYLDEYGYVIGVTVHEGNRNYVFITAYDLQNSTIVNRNATATAIFLDGSIQNITVNAKDTNNNIKNSNSRNAGYFPVDSWTTAVNNEARLQHNRWYTYTVNNAGVYTLKPAERMLIDEKKATDAAETLNSANLSLRAIDKYYSANDADKWSTNRTKANSTRAYGNDDSIYITVSPTTQNSVYTIDDIDGLYTGVQNVKLELEQNNATNAIPEQVYALYDSDNYIIAAIVLGKAQGNISNYAYIYSGAKSERYEDGYYYWTFEAIQNGEFKTFTARSKYSETINQLKQYHMMQLLFDGEYVSRVNEINENKFYVDNREYMGRPYPTSNTTGKNLEEEVDVYDVGHKAPTNYAGTSYVYMEDCYEDLQDGYNGMPQLGRLSGTIYLSGNTLYVDDGTNRDTGLAIRNNTKAVLIQQLNGDRHYSEHSSVRDAIDSMRDADDNAAGMQFRGRIVAPLSNGVAQWVVIISDTPLKTGDKTGVQGGGSISDNNNDRPVATTNPIVSSGNSASRLSTDSEVRFTDSKGFNSSKTIYAEVDRNGHVTIDIPVQEGYVLSTSDITNVTVNGINRTGSFTVATAPDSTTVRLVSDTLALNAGDRVIVTIRELALNPNHSFTLMLNANGGKFGDETTTKTSAVGGNFVEANLQKPTRDGYDFTGWYTVATGQNDRNKVAFPYTVTNSTTTIYAGWAQLKPPVETITNDTKVSTGTGTIAIDKGEDNKPVVESVTGYDFANSTITTENNEPKVVLRKTSDSAPDLPVYYSYTTGGKTYKLKLNKTGNDANGNPVYSGFDTNDQSYKDYVAAVGENNKDAAAKQFAEDVRRNNAAITLGAPAPEVTPITSVTFAAMPEKLTAGAALPTTVSVTTVPANTATATIAWVDAETNAAATTAVAGHSYKATVTVTASDNYTLTGAAFKAGTSDVASDNLDVAEDGKTATLTATLAVDNENPPADTYTVTVDDQIAGGTVTADLTSAKAGDTVTLTVEPAQGKKLTADSLKVTYKEGETEKIVDLTPATGTDAGKKWTFTMPAANVTVTAEFENDTQAPATYTVTVDDAITGGTVTADPTSAKAGDTVTLTVAPAANKKLKADSLKVMNGTTPVDVADGTAANTYTFEMPAANVTVTAEFENDTQAPATYTVTIDDAITGGTVTTDPTSAKAGDTVTLTVEPAQGKKLTANSLKVTYKEGETEKTVDLTPATGTDAGKKWTFEMPAADVTVTATFEDATNLAFEAAADTTELLGPVTAGDLGTSIDINEDATAPQADENAHNYTVTGKLNKIIGWDAFSSVEGQTDGHYVALKVTATETDGWTFTKSGSSEPSSHGNITFKDDGTAYLILRVENYEANDFTITATKDDVTERYVINLKDDGLTKAEDTDDNAVKTAVANFAFSKADLVDHTADASPSDLPEDTFVIIQTAPSTFNIVGKDLVNHQNGDDPSTIGCWVGLKITPNDSSKKIVRSRTENQTTTWSYDSGYPDGSAYAMYLNATGDADAKNREFTVAIEGTAGQGGVKTPADGTSVNVVINASGTAKTPDQGGNQGGQTT